ncbi:hypothetical protein [Streptomyces sp. NK08204]|uniref:hypothetical protein n=1 Tax=Streptomyces sp. NK08204 TaxID=2873260 RepID=UPI001CEDC277|nr:hypothetical protein [Streptomyces sp. NK08204]
MSPLERLLTEAIPIRPEPAERPAPATPGGYWTQAEQDAHWTTLCATVGTPDAQRPTRHATAHQTAA